MKKYALGVVTAAVVIFFLLRKVDVGKSLSLLKGVEPRLLLYCCAAYLAAHLFRALRFSVLLGDKGIPLLELLAITSIHNFLLQVLPMKTGEGGYPLLVKKVGGVNLKKGLASLLLVRCYDMMAFVFLVVFFFVTVYTGGYGSAGLLFSACAAVVLVFLYLFRHTEQVLVALLGALEKTAGLLGPRLAVRFRLKSRLKAFVEEFKDIGVGSKHYKLLLLSLMVWILTFGVFYLFINSLDKSVDYLHAALGSVSVVVVGMLPINAPGSVGTLEAGWVLGYVFMGVGKEAALASGLLMHAFVLAFGLLLSAIGLAVLLKAPAYRGGQKEGRGAL